MKKYIFYCVLFVTNCVLAIQPVDNFINNDINKNANISLLVKNTKTQKVVCEFRPNNTAVPASTMKIITTASALEILGSNFRFETTLEIDGFIHKDSILNGNLYIRGGGDPTLGSEKMGDIDFLSKWTEAIKKAGIKKINGQIIADNGLFDAQGVNVNWTWEDIGNYYAPAIYGISYLDNTFRLVFRSGKVGSTPTIINTLPQIEGLSIDNYLKSSSISFDSAYFFGAPHSYQRTVYGEIPANRNEFTVKGDIPFPGLLLAQHLHSYLINKGCIITQPPIEKFNTAQNKKVILRYYSPMLSEIIKETNYKSNNHYAESIFRYLGTKYELIASASASVRVIRDFWESKGLPVGQLMQCDGSGLSPGNTVSANFFVEVLSYMNTKSKNKDVFYNSLPVSGKSGTLTAFLKNTTLEGKVHAKSGTISRVKCYTGYIDGKNGTYTFALLVNNANGTSKAVTKKIEDFLLSIQ